MLRQPETDDALRREVMTDLAFLDRHWIRPSLKQPRWTTARAVAGVELRKPEKLAVADDGRVLVWDEGLGQVLILTADQQVESRSPQTQVRDVWWSPDGRPFAAVADAVIALADGSRQALTAGGTPLRDLAAGATGKLDERFVVDRDRKALYAFDRKGEAKTLQPAAGDVVDLAVGGHGELLVLDRKKNDVSRIGGLAAEPAEGLRRHLAPRPRARGRLRRRDLRPRQQREHDRHPRRQGRQRRIHRSGPPRRHRAQEPGGHRRSTAPAVST